MPQTTINFYHLTKTPLEKALPQLMERVLSSGLRGLVLINSEERLTQLDNSLWTYSSPKFLPHGKEADGNAEKQPIFLTQKEENPNGAEVLAFFEGQKPAFFEKFERVLDIFDGNDKASVEAARARWSEYKEQGFELSYFKQGDEGAWEKAA